MAATRPAPSATASSASRCLQNIWHHISGATATAAHRHMRARARARTHTHARTHMIIMRPRGSRPAGPSGKCDQEQQHHHHIPVTSCCRPPHHDHRWCQHTLKNNTSRKEKSRGFRAHMSRARPPRAADRAALTAGMRDPPPRSSTAARSVGASPLRSSSCAAGAAALLKKSAASSSKSCLRCALCRLSMTMSETDWKALSHISQLLLQACQMMMHCM